MRRLVLMIMVVALTALMVAVATAGAGVAQPPEPTEKGKSFEKAGDKSEGTCAKQFCKQGTR